MTSLILVCIFKISTGLPSGEAKQMPVDTYQRTQYQRLNDADIYRGQDYLGKLCAKQFGSKPDLKWIK